MFRFESLRIRTLAAIKALNFYFTLCTAFLAHLSMKPETNALKVSIIKAASLIKKKTYFCYYRLAKGITGILSHATEGAKFWFRAKRPAYRQLCLKLSVWIDKRICLPVTRFQRGLFWVPLLIDTAIQMFSKIGRLVLGEIYSFFNCNLRKLKISFRPGSLHFITFSQL